MITNYVRDYINLVVRIAHIICNHPVFWSEFPGKSVSRGRSVSDYSTDLTTWIRFPTKARFPVHNRVKTGSEVHPTYYHTGSRGSFGMDETAGA
jgi:hypothetical protein